MLGNGFGILLSSQYPSTRLPCYFIVSFLEVHMQKCCPLHILNLFKYLSNSRLLPQIHHSHQAIYYLIIPDIRQFHIDPIQHSNLMIPKSLTYQDSSTAAHHHGHIQNLLSRSSNYQIGHLPYFKLNCLVQLVLISLILVFNLQEKPFPFLQALT